jgi:hypothetical protein
MSIRVFRIIVLLSCAGLAAADTPFSCVANAGNPVIVRVEATAALVGDLFLQCSGGTPTPAGVPIPRTTITYTLNTNFTGRLVNPFGRLTEATLLIDDPTAGAASIPDSSVVPQSPSSPPQILCAPSHAPCADTGTGGSPSPYKTQPNVFLAQQVAANQIQWDNVPLDPPGPDTTRAVRITNVRANAAQLGLSGTLIPTQIVMFLSVGGTQAPTIDNPSQTVAFIQQGLVPGGTTANLSQCSSHNASLIGGAGQAVFDFNITLREGFAAAFTRRNAGLTTDGVTAPPLYSQNVPGFPYNVETGFYFPALFTDNPNVGLTDYGTRIRLSFNNVGAGAKIFLPVSVTMPGSAPQPPPPPVPPGITTPRLRLVHADQYGASAQAGFTSVAATASVGGTAVAEVIDGTAVYEVLNADAAAVETATIPVAIAFTSSGNLPAPGTAALYATLAPLSVSQSADALAPLPRFADQSVPRTAYSINFCDTAPLIVATNPSGLQVLVDGVTTITPQSFNDPPGTKHTIGAPSIQSGGQDTQYSFSSWSDGGAQSHQVTVTSSSTTYTANFAAHYLVSTSVSPPGSGMIVISPPSGDGFYPSGMQLQFTATPNSGYVFTGWSGNSFAGPFPTVSAVIMFPIMETATFAPACTFAINPTGASPDGSGGRTSVTVTTQAGCAWSATPNVPWISNVTSSGIGSGLAFYTVAPNTGAARSGTVTIAGQTLTINEAAGLRDTTPPFGSFDTPADNSNNVVGAVPVTGWALDNVGVAKVEIYRDAVGSEPKGNFGYVFIGTAVFVAGARPDVQALYPNLPNANHAGWGYQLLTNFLPPSGNGTFKLHAIAFDGSNNTFEIGTGKTILCSNATATKPFGTIDTPGQGGTISGSDSVNFGWALTPQPAIIPTDGSTITMVLDGVPSVHPVYNQFRSDIANLFPGYANSMGAVGFIHLNTLTLANGVHTISWNVFDNLGRGEGIGSRYFNVLNIGGSGSVAAPEDPIDESVAREGVRVRRGLNIDRQPDPIAADADGGYSVTVEEVGRIELHLGAATGKMLVQGEAQALPIGSTLKGGIFYWQPGPGFLGEYTLQFERPDGTKIPVRVNIVPKRYE